MGRGRERTAIWFGIFPRLHGKSAFEPGVISPPKGLLAVSGDVSGCRDHGGQGATGMQWAEARAAADWLSSNAQDTPICPPLTPPVKNHPAQGVSRAEIERS